MWGTSTLSLRSGSFYQIAASLTSLLYISHNSMENIMGQKFSKYICKKYSNWKIPAFPMGINTVFLILIFSDVLIALQLSHHIFQIIFKWKKTSEGVWDIFYAYSISNYLKRAIEVSADLALFVNKLLQIRNNESSSFRVFVWRDWCSKLWINACFSVLLQTLCKCSTAHILTTGAYSPASQRWLFCSVKGLRLWEVSGANSIGNADLWPFAFVAPH